MKTTKSGRKFCASFPLRISAGVLLALCTALTIVACKNPMIDEFLGYPKLTVTAPQFSEVVQGGYTPVARQIVILNVGKRAGGIKSVTVSPDTSFTIGDPAGSRAVGPGKNIADWTVQPKANLSPGAHKATITVTYRGAGVDSAKATASVELVVVAPGAPTPTLTPVLTVTVPTFTSVAEGYTTRPAAQNITIRNTGNAQATIASISVSPADKFDVNTGTGTVNGNNATTTRTVQPKAGLTRGTHMALITVTYNGTNGTTVSAAVSFEVTQAAATRTLVVTPPIFDDVMIGSSRPAAQNIIIENTGNAQATISSVTVSDTAKFTIGGSGTVVGAQSSIAGRTVQPKAGLAVGTHTATITVNYNGTSSPTATASVTFTVMPWERFVAVGEWSDQIAYSADGSSWKTAPMTTYANWQAITYGGGKFVAVAGGSSSGSTNIAAYSFDGINWIPITMPHVARWYGITYGNNKFVAIAYNASYVGAAYSSDGITWTPLATGVVSTSYNWTSVTYGNGMFTVMAAHNGNIRSSSDGITWNGGAWPATGGSWSSAIYAFSKYVAVNNGNKIAYSANPMTTGWTEVPLTGAWSAITYGNSKLVAVAYGSNQIATSADGITWATGALPDSGNWNSLTYTGGKFFAVANNKVAYSTTGTIGSWTVAAMPAGTWKSVAYGVAPH